MLKRPITYTDFNGNTVTEEFYFNLTKTEIVNLELGHGRGGLDEFIKKISKTQDNNALMKEFQRIVLLAYGEKSEDGKRFIKNEQLRQEFESSAAFDELIMEMLTKEDSAVNFFKGILPADVRAEAERLEQLPQPNIQPAETLRTPETSTEMLPAPRLATTEEAQA